MKKPLRKGIPKKKKPNSNLLFEFLNDICYSKKNILTTENEKQYSKFMITRFLSVKAEYAPIAEILNRYQDVLDNFQFHKFCLGIIPKRKVFLKYSNIKGTPPLKQVVEKVDIIANYFKVSRIDAYNYYSEVGDTLVKNIKTLYGIV